MSSEKVKLNFFPSEIGDGWGPAVLNSQQEHDFIREGQKKHSALAGHTGLVDLLMLSQMSKLHTLIIFRMIQVQNLPKCKIFDAFKFFP